MRPAVPVCCPGQELMTTFAALLSAHRIRRLRPHHIHLGPCGPNMAVCRQSVGADDQIFNALSVELC